ncbi:hypothetical protein A0H81_07129 [Grifola frondosa]|uniref:Uncharacterized protein n=1 Tax=Grifola frondosa TaxID=5627 RepID=A0A1C7M867_GRIFR|nr:hypothetical protein A0H81_07129 [Grifola frondosa]
MHTRTFQSALFVLAVATAHASGSRSSNVSQTLKARNMCQRPDGALEARSSVANLTKRENCDNHSGAWVPGFPAITEWCAGKFGREDRRSVEDGMGESF